MIDPFHFLTKNQEDNLSYHPQQYAVYGNSERISIRKTTLIRPKVQQKSGPPLCWLSTDSYWANAKVESET